LHKHESPQFFFALRYTNARRALVVLGAWGIEDMKIATLCQVNAIMFKGNSKAAAQLSRSIKRTSPPYKYGGWEAVFLGDKVEAVVHAVNEIHVGESGRPEHDICAFGSTSESMAGWVVSPNVSFRFGDFCLDAIENQSFA